MEAIVLNGKELAEKIEQEIREITLKMYVEKGKKAGLATIIIGDDSASKTYVRMKEITCERIGVNCLLFELKQETTTEQVLKLIDKLNNDDNIDGILLQHPVPKHIDERKCFNAIDKNKDVDGVTSASFGALAMGEESYASATPLGIMKLLEHYHIDVEGKEALVIGRSAILGKPMAMMLLNKNATVTIAHSKTQNIDKLVKKADIVVACVGKPKFVKKEWIKEGAVIIDAGYNPNNIGDVDLEGIEKIASAYTPVPGGVGPMTISSLLTQTVQSFIKRKQ